MTKEKAIADLEQAVKDARRKEIVELQKHYG